MGFMVVPSVQPTADQREALAFSLSFYFDGDPAGPIHPNAHHRRIAASKECLQIPVTKTIVERALFSLATRV